MGTLNPDIFFLSDVITISTPVLALIFICKHNVFASLLLGPFFKTSNVCAVKPSYDSRYARRRQICRTDKLDVRNKINEGPSAWWVNFVSETVIEE